jgi:hypothetical protein
MPGSSPSDQPIRRVIDRFSRFPDLMIQSLQSVPDATGDLRRTHGFRILDQGYPMEITLITSIAGMLAAIATLAITLHHWHRRYSRQTAELERLRAGRRHLAKKWVHQLRQARFYSALEEELCSRLSEHENAAPVTVKKQVRRLVESRLGDGTTHDHRVTKDSGIDDQLQEVRDMGFMINGEIVTEVTQAEYAESRLTAA